MVEQAILEQELTEAKGTKYITLYAEREEGSETFNDLRKKLDEEWKQIEEDFSLIEIKSVKDYPIILSSEEYRNAIRLDGVERIIIYSSKENTKANSL